jgi:alkylhydroperoxidase/carboxymuconolactone decarboxylase family protein YurZ
MADERKLPKPPKMYRKFVERYPGLGQAWDAIGEAGRAGPLSAREIRLVRLGVSMGALREGAVHSGVRKALAEGFSAEEVWQVVALAAGTLGLPSTVAVFSWAAETIEKEGKGTKKSKKAVKEKKEKKAAKEKKAKKDRKEKKDKKLKKKKK